MTTPKSWVEYARRSLLRPACDYHELPLVCGECEITKGSIAVFLWEMQHRDHAFRPVHLVPDPEGIEGTWRIPCPRA